MNPSKTDGANRMRCGAEALARPRQPVARASVARTRCGFWEVFGLTVLVSIVICACVVRGSNQSRRSPAFVSDTSRMVHVDGSRVDGNRFLLTAVRKPQSQARVTTSRVAMAAAKRNAIAAALGCVAPHRARGVSIDVGDLSGGSAGLMFALTIVDALDPLEIGGRVAGTGTISSTGVVGPIDQIAMKARAALGARADIFLVPKAQAALAKRAARDLRVVGVETLDEAVGSLGRTDGCDRAKGANG